MRNLLSGALHRLNHLPDLDLSRRLGRRARGFMVAVLFVLVAQATMYAQGSRDCVGEYEDALMSANNTYWTHYKAAEDNYSYWNPMRNTMQSVAWIEYLARAESAMFQLISCSALPLIAG